MQKASQRIGVFTSRPMQENSYRSMAKLQFYRMIESSENIIDYSILILYSFVIYSASSRYSRSLGSKHQDSIAAKFSAMIRGSHSWFMIHDSASTPKTQQ